MAWTAPHTYTSGEIITHALLNTDWRDNLLFIGTTHNHASAGATAGTAALGTLNSIAFKDQAMVPGAGTLARNGTVLMYGTSAIGGVAVAGTPSVRELGSAGTQAANGTHVHTLVQAASLSENTQGVVTRNCRGFRNGGGGAANVYATGTSLFIITMHYAPSHGGPQTYKLLFDGTLLATGSTYGTPNVNYATAILRPSGTYSWTGSYSGTGMMFNNVSIVGIGTPA